MNPSVDKLGLILILMELIAVDLIEKEIDIILGNVYSSWIDVECSAFFLSF